MFDLGWTELLLIGVVALIVVGPKDLPQMFFALGKFTSRIRGMAREFQRAMEDAAKESGASDITKDLRNIGNMANPRKAGMNALKDATKDLTNWKPDAPSKGAKPTVKGKPPERMATPVEAPDPAPAVEERPRVDPDAPRVPDAPKVQDAAQGKDDA